jgi:NADPH-dependent 2,4-dienoyl-CoA reductase/sulfur reductase-like enzyme
MKYLIVGGVAGGAATAARLRRNDEKAVIIIFERGHYISYANCGLPYYLGETIKDREKLFVETPKTFRQTLDVDVRISTEVVDIDPKGKNDRGERPRQWQGVQREL